MAKKPSKKKLLELIHHHCGIVTDIAKAINVDRRQIYRWIENDKSGELKQAIEDGRDQLIDLAKSGLKKNVEDGLEKSIIYVLGTLGRKEGFGNVIQVQNRDRLDEQLDDMTDEEILEAMADSRRRINKATGNE